MATVTSEMQAQIQQAREALVKHHQDLVTNNLVVWTGGNVSQRIRSIDGLSDVFVIKPSGVSYSDLAAEHMVVCDLNGNVVEGSLSPSSDTAAHAYVYSNLTEVGGVVHTHSNYATAWASVGKEIPCFLTAMADEFGGPIPVGPFAVIGDDSIGRGIVETLRGHRSPAVLMQNHGVFSIGKDARSAVKAAVMCEDVAKSAQIAYSIGEPIPLTQAQIDGLYNRYQNVYGN
jgi:L-ribulose-5-phosphate 4-epimerase